MRLHLANPLALLLMACCLCAACTETAEDYQDWLNERAASINQKCPQLLDSETRLDGIDVSVPNTLVYKCTLVKLTVKAADTAEFKRTVWPGLLSNVRVTRDLKKLRSHSTNIYYRFANKENRPICTVLISPQDYQ